MPDVRSLIESAESRGLRLFVADGKVKVRAPQALDGDTKALIEKLRGHKEEIKALLSQCGIPCSSHVTMADHLNLGPMPGGLK